VATVSSPLNSVTPAVANQASSTVLIGLTTQSGSWSV